MQNSGKVPGAAYCLLVRRNALSKEILCLQAAEGPESVEELKSRIRELETEQRLIQRELDNVTEAAQRAETQLRYTTACLLCRTY